MENWATEEEEDGESDRSTTTSAATEEGPPTAISSAHYYTTPLFPSHKSTEEREKRRNILRPIRFVVDRPAISARPTQPQRPPERLTPFSGKCAFALPFYSCICGGENACRRRLPCKRGGGENYYIFMSTTRRGNKR